MRRAFSTTPSTGYLSFKCLKRQTLIDILDGSDSQYRVVDHHIPSSGGTTLVRTVTPTPLGDKTEFPCLVWFHGGGECVCEISGLFSSFDESYPGFFAGSIGFDDFRLRIISVELQVSIVNVEYRCVVSWRNSRLFLNKTLPYR